MSFIRPTYPAVAVLLLSTLTTILPVTSDLPRNEAVYQYLGPGYSYDYLLPSSTTDKVFPKTNNLHCSVIALSRGSQFFSYDNDKQLCKVYSPSDMLKVNTGQGSSEMCYFRQSDWTKVYALTMGAGSKMYDSFVNRGDPSTWKVDKCNGNFCPNFFRHPFLDIWNNLTINEVKVVMYENQEPVVTLVFDGRNTDINSWFSHENLKSSPWSDISGSIPNVFSLAGIHEKRRFYISANFAPDCGDSGWLIAFEAQHNCAWEKFPNYPTIMYPEGNSKTQWINGGYRTADAVEIFIRLKT